MTATTHSAIVASINEADRTTEGGNMRELKDLRVAAANYREILEEAAVRSKAYDTGVTPIDPWTELTVRLPHLLSTLSPAALALMVEHTDLMGRLVEATVETFGVRPHLTVAR